VPSQDEGRVAPHPMAHRLDEALKGLGIDDLDAEIIPVAMSQSDQPVRQPLEVLLDVKEVFVQCLLVHLRAHLYLSKDGLTMGAVAQGREHRRNDLHRDGRHYSSSAGLDKRTGEPKEGSPSIGDIGPILPRLWPAPPYSSVESRASHPPPAPVPPPPGPNR
jgi:hypothetical protein